MQGVFSTKAKLAGKLAFLSILIFFLIEVFFFAQSLLLAAYEPHSRLLIGNLKFSVTKPRGTGRFEPVGEEGYKIGQDAYLYMEAANCKAEREGQHWRIYLILDMDIYHEDGVCVYSEKDVKSFNTESPREFSKTFLWVKIETRFLKPGEYKVEITVRDENSGKKAFVLEKFTCL